MGRTDIIDLCFVLALMLFSLHEILKKNSNELKKFLLLKYNCFTMLY